MLNFVSSMLCISSIHPFSLGNYLGTSLISGDLMRIRVTGVEWTWLGLEWPATPEIFGLLFREFLRIFVFVWSYKLLLHTIYDALTRCVYILSSSYLCIRINVKTTPRLYSFFFFFWLGCVSQMCHTKEGEQYHDIAFHNVV